MLCKDTNQEIRKETGIQDGGARAMQRQRLFWILGRTEGDNSPFLLKIICPRVLQWISEGIGSTDPTHTMFFQYLLVWIWEMKCPPLQVSHVEALVCNLMV